MRISFSFSCPKRVALLTLSCVFLLLSALPPRLELNLGGKPPLTGVYGWHVMFSVYSMGTEHRRPAHEYLPPNPKPYEYIVFRATEVKDLNVERHATDMQTAMLDNDPAIIGVSTTTYTLPFFSLLPSTPPFASCRNLHIQCIVTFLSPL